MVFGQIRMASSQIQMMNPGLKFKMKRVCRVLVILQQTQMCYVKIKKKRIVFLFIFYWYVTGLCHMLGHYAHVCYECDDLKYIA